MNDLAVLSRVVASAHVVVASNALEKRTMKNN